MFCSKMKMSFLWLLAIALIVLMGGSATVQAQDVATGSATATVLTALTVTADSAVRFGSDVLQGVPVSVSEASNDSSGVFRIAGAAGKQVSVYLALPEYLSHTTGGQDRMVIAFGSADAAYNDATAPLPQPETAGATGDQDPHNMPALTLNAGSGDMAIFLGGSIYPTADQTAGAYQADIVLTVAYNGS
jgi:hypothetical protein